MKCSQHHSMGARSPDRDDNAVTIYVYIKYYYWFYLVGWNKMEFNARIFFNKITKINKWIEINKITKGKIH